MVDVAAKKSDGASLGDSTSTPVPRASPSPAASADIGGSQTTVDAPEIGGDTELIPSVQKVPSKQRKAAKRRCVCFVFVHHLIISLCDLSNVGATCLTFFTKMCMQFDDNRGVLTNFVPTAQLRSLVKFQFVQ
jgi:hypothetical protein